MDDAVLDLVRFADCLQVSSCFSTDPTLWEDKTFGRKDASKSGLHAILIAEA